MGVRLPAEYQEVEYLESTGTQYINTWIVGRDSIYAESRLMFTQTDFSNGGFLGSRQGGGNQRFYLISVWQGNWQLGLGEDFFSTTAVLQNTLYDIKVGRDWNTYRFALNINGADILSGSSSMQTTYDMYVFAVNNYGTASRFCSARLYLLKISNDNSLLRDYIPCYRKSDNKPGMYDLVSDEFFTNAGTGEFLVGPDVIDSISPWLVARRRALLAQAQEAGVLATATGNPMTFTTDLVRPLKSLVIPFASSTGKINIALRGKNYLNAVDVYDDQTSIKVGSVRRFLLLVPNGTYTVSTNCTYTSGVASVFVGASSVYNDTMTTVANGCSPTIPRTLTVSDGKIVIGVRSSTSVGLVVTRTMLESGEIEIQVEKGGYATEYAKYSGSNLAVDWQSEFGLISNGTLELTEDGNANITTGGSNYHLDNVGRITTLDGTNTIWTDTNGTNIAEYWIKNT